MTEWRPNNKVTGQVWRDCERCGLPWPLKVLRRQGEIEGGGALVCPECRDEPSHTDNVRKATKEIAESTEKLFEAE